MKPSVTNLRPVVIEEVSPELSCGHFPVKRLLGDRITVEADIFAPGHDAVGALLKYRHQWDGDWTETAMAEIGGDRWRSDFLAQKTGLYRFTIEAWVNWFQTWLRALRRNSGAGVDIGAHLAIGAMTLQQVARRVRGHDAVRLVYWSSRLRSDFDVSEFLADGAALSELDSLLGRNRDREESTVCEKERKMVVDRPLAQFGAWYQVFPRSCASRAGRHGTLLDLAKRLPKLAAMGFDVVYLPPIHPIGRTARKGKNNSLTSHPNDPGSPWAVGSSEGGHKSIHPRLGTLADFHALLAQASALDIEIALDIALQCSPDHPYVASHPSWFLQGPEGQIQCAEDPPNRYEDVFSFNFRSPEWRSLWLELKDIFEFWIQQGVTVFRVDNPHTKAFAFWKWLIGDLKERWPQLILLSEGLTRPKPMAYLAKIGFTQSYDYFPWHNTKEELTGYYNWLASSAMKEYFRPSLWPNTPQYLSPILQSGGPAAFAMRFVLAATLGASYGIYGPAYEHCEARPARPGSSDYLDSEQYQLRCWEWETRAPLEDLIRQVNGIRRSNTALRSNDRLRFHPVDNDQIIAYSKTTEDCGNIVLMIVNLDPHHKQSGFVELEGEALGLKLSNEYTVHDLLTDTQYQWRGRSNYVELDPSRLPAHIMRFGSL